MKNSPSAPGEKIRHAAASIRLKTPEISPIPGLSFVANRDGETLPKPEGDQLPRCFWNVAATGDYGRDCRTGYRLALEYLAYEEDNQLSALLPKIIADMPRKPTGVEIGFLSIVSHAAAAGAAEGRRQAAYWTRRATEADKLLSGDKGRKSAAPRPTAKKAKSERRARHLEDSPRSVA